MEILKNLIVIIFCLLFLSSCMSSDSVHVKMKLSTADYLNPDVQGQSSPVVVTLYELISPVDFKQASFQDLQYKASKTLNNNLLDKTSFELQPGQTLSPTLEVSKSVKYIGVVVGYRNLVQSTWRAVIRVPKQEKHWYNVVGRHYLKMAIAIHSQQVEVHIVK